MSLNESLLRAFAHLKEEERDIKRRVEEMKVNVLLELTKEGADEVALSDLGVLVVVPKRSWKYPPKIVELEEELKKSKKAAEAKGDATYTDTPFVRFDSLKSKE